MPNPDISAGRLINALDVRAKRRKSHANLKTDIHHIAARRLEKMQEILEIQEKPPGVVYYLLCFSAGACGWGLGYLIAELV